MPVTPAPEEVLTIAPPPFFSINGISCFMHRKTPRRSTSTIRSHSSSVRSARRHRLFDTGVVEGEVEATERLGRLIQRGPHVMGPRHVTLDGKRSPPGLFNEAGRLLIAFFRKVGKHHVRALARERL